MNTKTARAYDMRLWKSIRLGYTCGIDFPIELSGIMLYLISSIPVTYISLWFTITFQNITVEPWLLKSAVQKEMTYVSAFDWS